MYFADAWSNLQTVSADPQAMPISEDVEETEYIGTLYLHPDCILYSYSFMAKIVDLIINFMGSSICYVNYSCSLPAIFGCANPLRTICSWIIIIITKLLLVYIDVRLHMTCCLQTFGVDNRRTNT